MYHIILFICVIILIILGVTSLMVYKQINDYKKITGNHWFAFNYKPKDCDCPNDKPKITQEELEADAIYFDWSDLLKDSKAIESDWEMVGKDLDSVLGKQEKK
jgi:heme/copper-type cytochrome/quinol oxidase subunit 2